MTSQNKDGRDSWGHPEDLCGRLWEEKFERLYLSQERRYRALTHGYGYKKKKL